MPHPLQSRLTHLRTRIQRRTALWGVSRVIAAVTVAVLVLGMADYWLRFSDRGIRLMATGGVLGVLGWTAYRYLYRTLSRRWDNVPLARRIQRRFPVMGDSLASAVDFLEQDADDPTAGSADLRRSVIAQASAETEQVDFDAVLRAEPILRAVGLAAAAVVVAVLIVLLNPTASRIALARLAGPLGDDAWPKKNHLAVLDPVTRVARGQAFEVEVIDTKGVSLPEEVRIHYRFEDADGDQTHQIELMQFLDEQMVARRDNVTRPFAYRIEGGDDQSMEFLDIELVEPPRLESFSVSLAPPSYSGYPAEVVQGAVRALVGTDAVFRARSDQALKSATLQLDTGERIPASLDPTGRQITVPAVATEGTLAGKAFLIERSTGYAWKLVDVEGLTSGNDERWDIQAIEDTEPSVRIDRPNGNVYVTPGAELPVSVVVKDDLAISAVALRFRRSDQPDATEERIELRRATDAVASPSGKPFSSTTQSGQSLSIDHRWDLTTLKLSPGMQYTFFATADDVKGQTGTSQTRQFIVVAPGELSDRLVSRQASILNELRRVLSLQRPARKRTGTLEIRLRETGRMNRPEVDQLRAVELGQRQVRRALTSPGEGVSMHVAGLLEELDNNRMESPDVRGQMKQIVELIDTLNREHLPIVQRELTSAVKSAEVAVQRQDDAAEDAGPEKNKADDMPEEIPIGPDVVDSLTSAGEHQQKVIDALEDLLADLSRWDSFRQFHRQLSQLLRDQEDLSGRTLQIAQRTLTQSLEDLPAGDRADLLGAARDQGEAARRLDRILQTMLQAVETLTSTDPDSAEMVSDARSRANELGLAASMRFAGDQLRINRTGGAMTVQEKIQTDLQEILDILSGRREHQLERLVKKLRQAEADLQDLANRQKDLQSRIEQAANRGDQAGLKQLGEQQAALEEETRRAVRRLERLQAEQAARTATEAVGQMDQAADKAGQGQGSEASDQAKQAGETLEKAADDVAQQRRQAEAELAAEQLARIEDALNGLRDRQTAALVETRRLDAEAIKHGQLSPGQQSSVRDLAIVQRDLHAETLSIAEALSESAVFAMAFERVADAMTRAATLLDDQHTDLETQQAQQSAIDRLDQLIAALAPEEPDEEEDPENNGGGGSGDGAGGDDSPMEALRATAQLKLMKFMQEEINRRTLVLQEKLEQIGPGAIPPAEMFREYAELSEDQGRLAELTLTLIPPVVDPEDVPDAMQESVVPNSS